MRVEAIQGYKGKICVVAKMSGGLRMICPLTNLPAQGIGTL